ncbi:hypothetical protein ACKAV7_010760 [Fusarium commune]|nr:hypothetical protein LZL87_012419 [Fusarium oxysporum]
MSAPVIKVRHETANREKRHAARTALKDDSRSIRTSSVTGAYAQERGLVKAKRATPSKPEREVSTSSSAGRSTGKGIWKKTTSVLKRPLVDVPLALTESLHNMPELHGEKVHKHDKMTGWKSGTAEAGTKLAYNFLDTSWCLFKQFAVGAVKGGPVGLVTGIGKASFGLIAKPGSGKLFNVLYRLLRVGSSESLLMCLVLTRLATFGLLAYPALGIYNSIVGSLSKTEKNGLKSRLAHDEYFAKIDPITEQEIELVLSSFGVER